jgi:thiosulfate reductase cytochrome b subunit
MEPPLKTTITTLQIIYSALMAGVLFFLIVSVVLVLSGGAFIQGEKQEEQIFLIIAGVLAVTAIFAGISIVKKKLENLQLLQSIQEKIGQYRSLLIIRAALMEGPSFFFIVGYLLFGNLAFGIGAVFCLAVMAAYFPTKSRIGNETGINLEF